MEKEIVPYGIASELKKLGFKETCFSFFTGEGKLYESEGWGYTQGKNVLGEEVSAPLYQQAFRWFRDEHNLCAEIYTIDMGVIEYCFQIRNFYMEKYVYDNFQGAGYSYAGTFNTYEDAELACLNKLIELVKSAT